MVSSSQTYQVYETAAPKWLRALHRPDCTPNGRLWGDDWATDHRFFTHTRDLFFPGLEDAFVLVASLDKPGRRN
jgi:hypothetical protein